GEARRGVLALGEESEPLRIDRAGAELRGGRHDEALARDEAQAVALERLADGRGRRLGARRPGAADAGDVRDRRSEQRVAPRDVARGAEERRLSGGREALLERADDARVRGDRAAQPRAERRRDHAAACQGRGGATRPAPEQAGQRGTRRTACSSSLGAGYGSNV